ncbi:hypothetical protein [Rhabdaerophilum sp. SD176]|uniref:hypothetical protein n=1 Tax=Rhabdaerophilum sp. SD176 TaxID=2983548 RepID=UPI0024DF9983|nr:hypothetical protein [Rhabdaerophilum sp. SD176]
MSKARDLTRFGETARQLRAVVPPYERIRDPDRLDGWFRRLLRRIIWSCPAMIVGAVGVFGWQYSTDRVLVPRGDVALLELARQTLGPMNPPGQEITETEIKGLAETIRQLGFVLQPATPRPWLKDLARMTEFNGDPAVLENRGRLLQHFLTAMEKVSQKDRPHVMANIILHAQSRIDWMPYAEILTRFSVDLMDLHRTGKIPELEQAMRAALEKARVEGNLIKAVAALEKEKRELELRRVESENDRVAIRRYIQSQVSANGGRRACADAFVTCQRKLEGKR